MTVQLTTGGEPPKGTRLVPRPVAQTQYLSAHLAHAARPALGSQCLPSRGIVAGITGIDREIGKELQAAPQAAQARMMRHEEYLQRDEIVRLGHGEPQFLKQPFKYFSADC